MGTINNIFIQWDPQTLGVRIVLTLPLSALLAISSHSAVECVVFDWEYDGGDKHPDWNPNPSPAWHKPWLFSLLLLLPMLAHGLLDKFLSGGDGSTTHKQASWGGWLRWWWPVINGFVGFTLRLLLNFVTSKLRVLHFRVERVYRNQLFFAFRMNYKTYWIHYD